MSEGFRFTDLAGDELHIRHVDSPANNAPALRVEIEEGDSGETLYIDIPLKQVPELVRTIVEAAGFMPIKVDFRPPLTPRISGINGPLGRGLEPGSLG